MGCRVTDRAKEDGQWGMEYAEQLCRGQCKAEEGFDTVCPHYYKDSNELDYGIVLNIERMKKLIDGDEIILMTRDGKRVGIAPTLQWDKEEFYTVK